MFRFMRKREGFTLIELMMVVAVIGILAAVLIPKIGGTKDSAKLSGVESNARTVQASVESMISRYQQRSTSNLTAFSNSLSGTLTAVVNPFTNEDAAIVVTTATTSAITTTVAVTINNSSGADVAPNGTAANKGAILVTMTETATVAPFSINSVTITPYDNLGNAMPATVITP